MRTLYVFSMITIDSFFEGPAKGDIGWHNVDAEFNRFAIDQLHATDLFLFGHRTYEGMASYWPTPIAIKNDPEVAGMMNSVQKVVFSRSLEKADWTNTRLVKQDVPEEISMLRLYS